MAKDMQKEIDQLVTMTPELPEDFESWCGKQMKRPLIYYHRNGNTAEFKCGACGKTYFMKTSDTPEYGTFDIETPRRHHPAMCIFCGNQSFYEWTRITHREYEWKRFYLYQLTEEKTLIIRIFDYSRSSSQQREMRDCLTEVGRFFLEYGQVKKLIRIYSYTQDKNGWILKKTGGYPYMDVVQGRTYPGWEEMVKESTLKYCPLQELQEYIADYYGNRKPDVTHIDALMTYANNPAIEMYQKMGMRKMVRRLCAKEGIYGLVNRRKKTVKGQLRLKKKENMNKLVKEEGDCRLLEMLQYEEKMGFSWKPEWERKIKKIWDKDNCKRVTHMLGYMTMQQLLNRVEKYEIQLYSDPKGYKEFEQILKKYDDYLIMREELGYDMTNEVFLYPKDLQKKHQEMVKESNERRDELTIKRKNKEFPDIANRYEALCRKYQAAAGGYVIRPARSAGEIIMEGRILHHCVGGDNYLSRHNAGKSTILFLRKSKKPEEPYITIEINGTRIVQWYGAHDKKPKKEFFDQYLKDYTEQLKQREKKKVLVAAG